MKKQYIIPAVFTHTLRIETNILVGSPEDDPTKIDPLRDQEVGETEGTASEHGDIHGDIKPATGNQSGNNPWVGI